MPVSLHDCNYPYIEDSKITHTLGSFSTLGTLKVAMFTLFTPAILEMEVMEGRRIDERRRRDFGGAIAVDPSSFVGKTLVSISTSS